MSTEVTCPFCGHPTNSDECPHAVCQDPDCWEALTEDAASHYCDFHAEEEEDDEDADEDDDFIACDHCGEDCKTCPHPYCASKCGATVLVSGTTCGDCDPVYDKNASYFCQPTLPPLPPAGPDVSDAIIRNLLGR